MSSPKRTRIVDLRRQKPPEPRPVSVARPQSSAPLERTPVRTTAKRPKETLTRDASPLRARRKRRRRVLLFFLVPLALLLIYGVHFVSYSAPLSIRTITVTGAHDVDPQILRSYIESYLRDRAHGFVAHNNILSYDANVLSTTLKSAFPQLAKVEITRPSPLSQELVVTIVERHAFARWCLRDDACYLMDDKGYIFAPIDSSNAESPAAVPSTQHIFRGGITAEADPVGQGFVSAHLPWILLIMKVFDQAGHKPIGATVENEQDVSVSLASGMSIKTSFGQDAPSLTQNLRLILNSEELRDKQDQIEYIDLRFGNRVYYKLKGEAQTSNASTTPQTPAH